VPVITVILGSSKTAFQSHCRVFRAAVIEAEAMATAVVPDSWNEVSSGNSRLGC
jgi:hypothetical protein